MSAKKKATGAKAKARTNAKPDSNLKRGARGKVRGSSKIATAAKPGTGSKKDATALAKTRSRPKSGKMETAIRKNMKDLSVKIESMAPPGSPERVAAGVAAVAGGALIAGATLGAGPTALAGAAGAVDYAMFTVGDNVHYYAVDHSPSHLWDSATWEISEALLPHLPTVLAGPQAWDASDTIRRAIEIRDGVIQNPRILSFQGRSPEYPHPVAAG